jgi:dolichyl-phosphate beta-glucosyltransferase
MIEATPRWFIRHIRPTFPVVRAPFDAYSATPALVLTVPRRVLFPKPQPNLQFRRNRATPLIGLECHRRITLSPTMRALLVIPAFRESKRLPPFLSLLLSALDARHLKCHVQVVDDGSGDEEAMALQTATTRLSERHARLLPIMRLDKNRGKGGAVRAGLMNAATYDWVGFVDADGAVPAEEVCRLLELASVAVKNRPALFGCRIRMLGRKIERSPFRHLVGRMFASLVGAMINSHVHDSQCGLKLLPSVAYQRIAPALQEEGFCFDVEWIAALAAIGWPIEEVPIDWSDQPGSKVSLVRDACKMLLGIQRIKARTKSPAYTSRSHESRICASKRCYD